MIRLAFILLLAVSASAFAAPCPVQGDNPQARMIALNRLKNRVAPALPIDTRATLAAILRPGDDRHRFDQNSGAILIGYIAEIKPGGSESCNCHAKDLALRDTHIALVASPKDFGNPRKYVIVEVTPRSRKPGLDVASLKKLFHKKVTVTGDLFFDAEHTQNAENTNPGGKKNWRGSAWEDHPVFAINPSE